ncbi:hypothetical protein HYC85_019404 [Camellia sinensis]|uniref:Prefoldin subunit 2 n=1 Tax=Camellia sinensis TaxID=4442 RepID=A0A7J7GLR3_CAMSI|nr:hypothetical protein HYC85_019404 [Camellia sinensis]
MSGKAEAEGNEPINEQAVANIYGAMRSDINQIYSKITELEMEASEHSLVMNAIKPLDPSRRCYRMIGGVLVERTIKEVLLAVQRNKEGLEEVIVRLNEALEKKKNEVADLEVKYKIRIRKSDEVQDDAGRKEGSAQGVLVGPAVLGSSSVCVACLQWQCETLMLLPTFQSLSLETSTWFGDDNNPWEFSEMRLSYPFGALCLLIACLFHPKYKHFKSKSYHKIVSGFLSQDNVKVGSLVVKDQEKYKEQLMVISEYVSRIEVDLLRGQKSDKVDVTLQLEELEIMNNVLHAKYEKARRRRSCVVSGRISVTWLPRMRRRGNGKCRKRMENRRKMISSSRTCC